MPARITDLPRLLGTNELKPVWLIAGAEHLLVMEAADQLRARARELGFAEREIHDVDHRFNWDELAMSGAAMSLFSTLRVIELRMPTGKPGKEGSAAIVAWCADPPPDTLLMITAQEWSKSHEGAWFKSVEKVGVAMPVWTLKREEVPGWISSRMKSRGLKATRDAIELFAERIEGNLLAAAQEIDKLSLLVGDAVLDIDTLEASVADDARFDAFRLTDAAIAGDATRALRMVEGLRAEGAEAIALLGWLLNQLRVLYRLASAGGNLNQAFQTERIWDAKQAGFKRALKAGDAAHWERCIIHLGRIDRIAKGRGAGDVWREIERLITAIAMPRRGAALLDVDS